MKNAQLFYVTIPLMKLLYYHKPDKLSPTTCTTLNKYKCTYVFSRIKVCVKSRSFGFEVRLILIIL